MQVLYFFLSFLKSADALLFFPSPEFAEDKLWYLAKVLAVDGRGGATVEFVEYGGTAVCGPDQVEPRQADDALDAPACEPALEPALERRSRGDSKWLVGIDRNLGSLFPAAPAPGPDRARGDVQRTLTAVAAMLAPRSSRSEEDEGVSDSE